MLSAGDNDPVQGSDGEFLYFLRHGQINCKRRIAPITLSFPFQHPLPGKWPGALRALATEGGLRIYPHARQLRS